MPLSSHPDQATMNTFSNLNRRRFLIASSSALSLSPVSQASQTRVDPQITAAKPLAPHKANANTSARWLSSHRGAFWQDLSDSLETLDSGHYDVRVHTDSAFQVIDGFGACFNELGWDALSLLSEDDRSRVLHDFFGSDASGKTSMGFTHCRMPIAANDFARGWYSYNETADDFEMNNFSIKRDESSLIPYIKEAQKHQPNLTLWASPWSPPSWMKTNGHYAQNVYSDSSKSNGLSADRVVLEGQDGFIKDARYYKAYALYFKKFIESYRQRGIDVSMVMPQNEFNSNQVFPSCVWTPEALAEFIPYLHEAISPLNVELFFGTLERPDTQLFELAYAHPQVKSAIEGIGFQWAGRDAVKFLNYDHPELKLYQTEQECGDGKNDGRFARYTWDLMRDYMESGVNVYEYWNMALVKNQASSWGWKQNSLITVDPVTKSYHFTPDYYTLKHVCHFVKPGARRVDAQSWTGYDNALAFTNTNGEQVLIIQNDMPEAMSVRIGISGAVLKAKLPANSLNSIAL